MTRPFKGDVLVFDGMHSRVIALPELKLAIKIFPKHLRENALKEYKVLLIADGRKINCVPKPISLIEEENFVAIVREFIDGEYFVDYVKGLEEEEFKLFIGRLLHCLRQFDELGIIIEELSSPRKNIVIREGNPYIIDLERWSYGVKSTNITRFLGFLVKIIHSETEVGRLARELWGEERLLKVSKRYKERRDFEEIVRELGLKGSY